MKIPEEISKELDEITNKLDEALKALERGELDKSEARKMSKKAGKRFSEIVKEYAKTNKK